MSSHPSGRDDASMLHLMGRRSMVRARRDGMKVKDIVRIWG